MAPLAVALAAKGWAADDGGCGGQTAGSAPGAERAAVGIKYMRSLAEMAPYFTDDAAVRVLLMLSEKRWPPKRGVRSGQIEASCGFGGTTAKRCG